MTPARPAALLRAIQLLDALALGYPAGERPRGQGAGPHRQGGATADERLEHQADAGAHLEGVVGGGAERVEDGEGATRAQVRRGLQGGRGS